jgi:uncharacterized delta-60 repeat protein
LALARYNTDGSLDTSFDGDGRIVGRGGWFDKVRDVAVQPDGKIVVVGDESSGPSIFLLRFNEDGSLDSDFRRNDITPLGVTRDYFENGAPVVLNDTLHVVDPELAAQGHYAGATLTLMRHEGASPEDVFSATGALAALVEGGDLVFDSVHVGSVAKNSGGTLVLTFNSDATQARMDGVLQALAYSNNSEAPPVFPGLDWIFSDGNSSAQGTGGALSAVGTSIVSVLLNNDAPTLLWGDGDAEVVYVRGDAPVVLDSDVRAYDVEAATRGDYNGASLRLSRSGAPSPEDVFSATGSLGPLTRGPLVYSGEEIGAVLPQRDGDLLIEFNWHATQAHVDGVLQSIAYSNSSDAPPDAVQIHWQFRDGWNGEATGDITVRINSGEQSSDTAGASANRFVFDTPFDALSDVATISGFRPGVDMLLLSDVIFASPPRGVLAPESFVAGASAVAHDADDYILYDTATGSLSYDPDGSGTQSAMLFAVAANVALLTANDVHVGLL